MNNGAKLLAVLVVVVFASAGIYYAMKPGPQGAQSGTKTPATPGSGAGSRGAGSPTVTPGGSGAKPPSESAFNRPTPMPPVTPPPPSGSGTPGAGSSANGPAGATPGAGTASPGSASGAQGPGATPSGTGPSGATPPGSGAGAPPAPGAGSATPSGGSATPAGAGSKPTTPGSAPGSGPGSAPGAAPGSTPGSTPAGSGAAPPAGGTPPASGPGTLGANTPVPGTGVRPAPPTGGMDYTIRDGDTFMTIAEEYFGDRNKWGLIAKENPTVDPTKLAIGQKIRLPARGAASAPLTAPPPPSVPAGATLHTVVDGDTLASLADRYYGTKAEAAWRRIYDANKAAIGADPGRLKTGQKLVIPPKP